MSADEDRVIAADDAIRCLVRATHGVTRLLGEVARRGRVVDSNDEMGLIRANLDHVSDLLGQEARS